jgi:chromosome segregation ATPase
MCLKYFSRRLEEDKQILDREYARMPKPQELERQIEQLKAQNQELYREIQQRQEEISDMRQSVNDKNVLLETERKDLKELVESIENYKAEYVSVNTLPNQINKEFDKLFTEKEYVPQQIFKSRNIKNIQSFFFVTLKGGDEADHTAG